MSAPLTIPANERGVIRLFALDSQLAIDIAHSGVLDRLHLALGVDRLNDADVQLVPLCTIADLGLPAFLTDAYDIDPDEISPHAAMLTAQTGDIAILRSGAFAGRMAQLVTDGPARLIASFTEPGPDWTGTPMHTASARSRIVPRAARLRARRIGFAIFAAMMTLIVAIVILVAS